MSDEPVAEPETRSFEPEAAAGNETQQNQELRTRSCCRQRDTTKPGAQTRSRKQDTIQTRTRRWEPEPAPPPRLLSRTRSQNHRRSLLLSRTRSQNHRRSLLLSRTRPDRSQTPNAEKPDTRTKNRRTRPRTRPEARLNDKPEAITRSRFSGAVTTITVSFFLSVIHSRNSHPQPLYNPVVKV